MGHGHEKQIALFGLFRNPSFMFCVEFATSVKYTEIQRPVIEKDVVKAIKFK